MPFNSFEDYSMSWRPILDKSNRVLYSALAQQLEHDVRSGVLKPGTKLPPQRELADFLDVNVSTVSKAFKLCELQGLLSATVGNGTFVAYDALHSSNLMVHKNQFDLIDLGPTSPEPSGNPILLKMTQELLAEPNAQRLFSYYTHSADTWQKDAAVTLTAACGHLTTPEQILFAGGGQNALTVALSALFRHGDKLAVDDHTYPGIKTAAVMLGLQLIPVPSGPDGMDSAALEALCRTEAIRGIYLIPACHNPTTAVIPEEKKTVLAGIAQKYECILIEDGTYQMLHPGMRSIASRIPEQSVFILSLSKGIAPGLRLSYLAVPSAWREKVSDALYSLNVTTVPMMSELAARVIVSGQNEEILKQHQICTRKRNMLVNRILGTERCLGSSDDIFRWLLLPERNTGAEFEALARSRGVQVFAAERFSVGATAPAKAVRLAIGTPDSLEQLETGLNLIAELLT